MKAYTIAASILSADWARFGEETAAILSAGADRIHFDVMDNHYVPNLSFGAPLCQALRSYGITAAIDVHLMVQPVDELIAAFAKAGATSISFHPEASLHVDRSLQLIRDLGCLAGLALNPASSLNWAVNVADKLDALLLMSVNPGFGGQRFIPASYQKISEARQWINTQAHDISLAVDGGVNLDTIRQVKEAGANVLVVGSALFHKPYEQRLQQLRQAIEK